MLYYNVDSLFECEFANRNSCSWLFGEIYQDAEHLTGIL